MPTILIKLILAWIVICLGLLLPVRIFYRRYPPKVAYSFGCAVCAALNTLPIAFFFSPTILILGWFPFPAPAGLVLIYCAFDFEFHANNNELIRNNRGIAMIGFLGFWLVAWIMNLIYISRKLQNVSINEDFNPFRNKRSIFWIITAFIIFTEVVYYFGFCY